MQKTSPSVDTGRDLSLQKGICLFIDYKIYPLSNEKDCFEYNLRCENKILHFLQYDHEKIFAI